MLVLRVVVMISGLPEDRIERLYHILRRGKGKGLGQTVCVR